LEIYPDAVIATRRRDGSLANGDFGDPSDDRQMPLFRDLSGHKPNMTCDNLTMRSRFLPVLGIFAGGLVYTVLPRGAFGAYDVASRAAVTGAVAGVTCLLVLTLSKRWGCSR
jgi:hypothetical protein